MKRKPAVSIRELRFSYPDGTPALRGVSLEVHRGESVGLIGPNGAGKSTLLLHLNGILLGEGEVRIMDTPVNEKNLIEVRRKVGFVFQNPDDQLFMPTVFDDVAFGPLNLGMSPSEIHTRVSLALEKVGLAHFEDRSPHHLSYGEKKRVALATVISMDPEILILDEPTGGLDPRGRRELIRLIAGLEGTKIIASHDLDMIRHLCRRVMFLSRGEKVADDATEAVLENSSLLLANGL